MLPTYLVILCAHNSIIIIELAKYVLLALQ